MAGATLHVEVDDARVRVALDRLQAAGTDLRPVMEDVGEYLLRTTRERFRDREDPDGASWAPLSPAYRARKRRKQNMVLTLDGHLGGSPAPAGIDRRSRSSPRRSGRRSRPRVG